MGVNEVEVVGRLPARRCKIILFISDKLLNGGAVPAVPALPSHGHSRRSSNRIAFSGYKLNSATASV